MRFDRERQLYPMVRKHFASYPYRMEEVPFEGKRIDLVFVARNGVTSSVEVKLQHWKGALHQATVNRLAVDYSYVALPKEQVRESQLKDFHSRGIGVLSVDGKASATLKAARSKVKDYGLAATLRRAVRGK